MKRSENFKEESETQTELSWTFVNEQTEVEAKSWGTNSLEQETNLEKVNSKRVLKGSMENYSYFSIKILENQGQFTVIKLGNMKNNN